MSAMGRTTSTPDQAIDCFLRTEMDDDVAWQSSQ